MGLSNVILMLRAKSLNFEGNVESTGCLGPGGEIQSNNGDIFVNPGR